MLQMKQLLWVNVCFSFIRQTPRLRILPWFTLVSAYCTFHPSCSWSPNSVDSNLGIYFCSESSTNERLSYWNLLRNQRSLSIHKLFTDHPIFSKAHMGQWYGCNQLWFCILPSHSGVWDLQSCPCFCSSQEVQAQEERWRNVSTTRCRRNLWTLHNTSICR